MSTTTSSLVNFKIELRLIMITLTDNTNYVNGRSLYKRLLHVVNQPLWGNDFSGSTNPIIGHSKPPSFPLHLLLGVLYVGSDLGGASPGPISISSIDLRFGPKLQLYKLQVRSKFHTKRRYPTRLPQTQVRICFTYFINIHINIYIQID